MENSSRTIEFDKLMDAAKKSGIRFGLRRITTDEDALVRFAATVLAMNNTTLVVVHSTPPISTGTESTSMAMAA